MPNQRDPNKSLVAGWIPKKLKRQLARVAADNQQTVTGFVESLIKSAVNSATTGDAENALHDAPANVVAPDPSKGPAIGKPHKVAQKSVSATASGRASYGPIAKPKRTRKQKVV